MPLNSSVVYTNVDIKVAYMGLKKVIVWTLKVLVFGSYSFVNWELKFTVFKHPGEAA